MVAVYPFCGLRPRNDLAGSVIAPPYDVLSEEEARAIVASNPKSFLRVTRSEVNLPEGSDAHGPEAYTQARSNLEQFVEEGWMVQDTKPAFYLYRQTWRGATQIGLMAVCNTADYDSGEIKKHELTRPDKEQDRVDHVEGIRGQSGLVFVAFRDRPEVSTLLNRAAQSPCAWEVTTDDGVLHALHIIDDPADIRALEDAFKTHVPALYIADGHHRSAAASRVAKARPDWSHAGRLLVGIFPDTQLNILAYNRVVHDLNGHSAEAFLSAIQTSFTVEPTSEPVPQKRGTWTMFFQDTWYVLTPDPSVVPHDDPVARLDVSVLQDRILSPLLNIDNPRTNTRISFVGGIRGPQALENAVRSGKAAVAFHMYPTGMDQLFDVADADLLMPPKSTWFEPKLRGGVLLHMLDTP